MTQTTRRWASQWTKFRRRTNPQLATDTRPDEPTRHAAVPKRVAVLHFRAAAEPGWHIEKATTGGFVVAAACQPHGSWSRDAARLAASRASQVPGGPAARFPRS